MNTSRSATFLAQLEQLKIRLMATQEAELIEDEFNRIDEMTAEEVKFQLIAASALRAKKAMGSEPISDLERVDGREQRNGIEGGGYVADSEQWRNSPGACSNAITALSQEPRYQPDESTLFVHAKRSAENAREHSPSRRFARPFPAHLNAMGQRVTDIRNVFLFGINGNTARADHGRRRTSRLPGVTWVQEGIELTIAAAIDADRRLEVELSLGRASGRVPHAIFWADPNTLSGDNIVVDLFGINRAGNGRYLVGIKKPELERRLAAISKARNEGHTDKAIAFSPLVEFD